jgi:hypothetical protein
MRSRRCWPGRVGDKGRRWATPISRVTLQALHHGPDGAGAGRMEDVSLDAFPDIDVGLGLRRAMWPRYVRPHGRLSSDFLDHAPAALRFGKMIVHSQRFGNGLAFRSATLPRLSGLSTYGLKDIPCSKTGLVS